jgi:hypothetical protein
VGVVGGSIDTTISGVIMRRILRTDSSYSPVTIVPSSFELVVESTTFLPGGTPPTTEKNLVFAFGVVVIDVLVAIVPCCH